MTTTGPATTAENIFRQLVWDPVVAAGLAAFFIDFPFLNLPVIRPLISWAAQGFAGWLFDQLRLLTDVTAIQIANSLHQDAFEAASLRLKIVALDEGVESPAYAQALSIAKQTLSQFTQFHTA